MANFLDHRKDSSVAIPYMERENKVTIYVVNVSVGEVHWQVKHRYSAFASLHEALVADHGVAKDLLPPKKVIGNLDPAFIEKRRTALEAYLKTVLNFLKQAMPRELAHFLYFHHYEVLFLLQNLSLSFFNDGDALLQKSKSFKFPPLQLHAISERLKQPCPQLNNPDKRLDFSHVLDFCSQLNTVQVEGSNLELNSSNIVPNKLPFDLIAFKNLQHLSMSDISVNNICDAQSLRSNLLILTIHNSLIRNIVSLAMCDVMHKDIPNAGSEFIWKKLVELDLSHNCLEEIDESLKLMPNLRKLKLDHNRLSSVKGLTHLPRLSHLSLAANNFESVDNLHTKLGNILSLNMAENRIKCLAGFSKLYSLERLELASNAVVEISEARYLSSLPCLEYLTLTGNPVAATVDYRTRVLERVGLRASEICLDNEKPSQKELDTIAVLQALRIVQEGRSPARSNC
ncbi:hypothetical protein B566_EDAN011431 [Ephemera danica]|nr:hypothetical protein B566_EDAN011431 [Ephemera danica]